MTSTTPQASSSPRWRRSSMKAGGCRGRWTAGSLCREEKRRVTDARVCGLDGRGGGRFLQQRLVLPQVHTNDRLETPAVPDRAAGDDQQPVVVRREGGRGDVVRPALDR